MKKIDNVKNKLPSHLAQLVPKINQNVKTEEPESSSYWYRVFSQVKRGILQLLFGGKAGDYLEGSLQEFTNLSRFTPTNVLETYMKQPSDIWEHLATLYMLTVEFDLKTILELGTAEGESTIALLQAAHQIDGNVTSIDINPCTEARKTIENSGLARALDHWSFVQGDDLQVYWAKSIDHLFIDTSHKFEHTLKELQKYEPYVREGGIITLHDIISFPEVMHAILEHLKNRNDLRLYTYLHNNGLAVIFKGRPKNIR